MADNEKEKSESNAEDKKVESKESPKESEQTNTVDAKPNQTENGINADIVNKLNSFKQEIIDYIDLKLASTPIAKVEKVETKEEKKLPVW